MHVTILNDILIIFGLSILVVYVFSKLKVPTIVGFLLTGILAGPYGLGLVSNTSNVVSLAEIGVMLILFSIGIEFSLSKLFQFKKDTLLGGSIQVITTIIMTAAVCLIFQIDLKIAIFIGFLVTLSSTAIAMAALQSEQMAGSPHGRLSLSISIFQDLAIIVMILVTPTLAGKAGDISVSVVILVAKIFGIALFLYISIKWLIPKLMYRVAKTRIRALFLLNTIAICLAIVWLSSLAGISASLGAFLAGLIISETDYSHEALGFIEPFREVFSSFFFVSMGMLLSVAFIWENISVIIIVFSFIFIIKSISIIIAVLVLGYPLKTALLTAFVIFQIGEFSFVLATFGMQFGLIDDTFFKIFLASAVLSMSSAPILFKYSASVLRILSKIPLLKKISINDGNTKASHECKLSNHLIIIGFGLNGRNLAKAAKTAGLPYIIIEMNPVTVRNESAAGEPIFYGDASKEAVLHNACIHSARIAVVAISDPTATRAITYNVKKHNPEVCLIVRTRFQQEVEDLFALGADEVVPEEFETSIEIFTRVLNKYLVPKDEIEAFVAEIRSHGYDMLRAMTNKPAISDLRRHVPDYEIVSFRLKTGCEADGKSLAELALREKNKVTLLAIRRNDDVIANPSGKTTLLAGDILILFGFPEKLSHSAKLFESAH